MVSKEMTYKPDNKDWKEGADWGLNEGIKHTESSPETKKMFKNMNEDITNIKINMAEFNKDIKSINKQLSDHIVQQDKDMKEIKSLVHDGMNAKANKWVEIVAKSILMSIGLGLLSVIGALVYQAIIHFN